MFYSHSLLARKTPLGMVWIASHSQKMKKTQIDCVDIQSSADDIMYPRAPIALRLSGHLLVGLVKIYSRKVNYLFQDCNRMLTNTRVVVASIHINLPTNADKAPFESITLPETYNLDALELEESINLIDDPDNHQKDYEQITLAASAEQDQYVAFFIDKDINTNSSIQLQTRHDAEPMEEDVLPPLDDDLDVSRALNSSSFEGPGSKSHGNGSFQTFDANNNIQNFQKIEVMRDNNLELENRLELDNTSNDVELNDHSTSVTKRKHSFDPMLEDILVSREEPLPSTFHVTSPVTTFDSNIVNMDISPGQALPHLELELQPSPPVRERKRKRRMKEHSYDENIVLSNVDMKKQLKDTTDLIRKRRKVSDDRQNEQVLHETLQLVRSRKLQELCSRLFLSQSNNSSHMEASSEFANELPHVASEDLQKEPKQQNNDRNTEREQQDKLNAVPENSQFDMHTDIQPREQDELHLIPIPEIARFDLDITYS
ncbi:sister chromatid cohesion 1 protein 3-like [Zingiber officinale]|uniref:sister chromatid cohesion 1 protein 3-like n=1 Tax=Zingiber officinale TaxID=94328 RepID=UPI001C4BB461|nr:sister chromatid cohesion 1 protein 3-like [Zingiber officinale]